MATIVSLVCTLIFSVFSFGNALSSNYYDKSCPNAEVAITNAVKKAMMNGKIGPAALLRMHFHDCFIRGCDASVLLGSSGKNTAERDGPPNISLHVFYVIDSAKKDIDYVPWCGLMCIYLGSGCKGYSHSIWRSYMGGAKGRKDGRVSRATETRGLLAPTFNISQLQQSFSQRGLSMEDLVALSGGHTLGFSYCSSFKNRIHNFNTTRDVDPTLHPSFAASSKSVCHAITSQIM